jgi:hypothetical protein
MSDRARTGPKPGDANKSVRCPIPGWVFCAGKSLFRNITIEL